MKINRKNLLSCFLVLVIFFSSSMPIFAIGGSSSFSAKELYSLNYSSNDTTVHFQKISEKEIIYTYVEKGKTYKNVDIIISPNAVFTEVYLLQGENEIIMNKFKTIVNNNGKINTVSFNDMSMYTPNNYRTTSSHSWQYHSDYYGNTSIRNQSIAAIGIVLGNIIGGKVIGPILSVAAYLFDKNIPVVYYHKVIYKDTNSPRLRPILKIEAYFYEDSDHNKPIAGNPVVSIIKP